MPLRRRLELAVVGGWLGGGGGVLVVDGLGAAHATLMQLVDGPDQFHQRATILPGISKAADCEDLVAT